MKDRVRVAAVSVCVVGLVLLAANLVFGGEPEPKTFVELARERGIPAPDPIPFSERPAFKNDPTADDLQMRLQDQIEAGGQRPTIQPSCSSCPQRTVWVFGGSAVYGIGQSDRFTIASGLVRLADADDVALTVENLGVSGYTFSQERDAFRARLAETSRDQYPDLVVFFSGFNDVAGTIVTSSVNGAVNGDITTLNPDDQLAFTLNFVSPTDLGGGEAMGKEAARRYRLIADDVDELARFNGIEVAKFFQPDALASDSQRAAINGTYPVDPDFFRRGQFDQALETASTSLSPDVTNLRHLFDRHDSIVFADVVHTNEEGARVQAAAIYDVIGPALKP